MASCSGVMAASTSSWGALRACRRGGAAAFSAMKPLGAPRRAALAPVRASLDAGAALAVSQQAAAFAAVVGAEAAYTGLNTPASAPGRPAVTSTLAGVGAVLVALALLKLQADVVGYGVGFGGSTFLFAYYLQRTKDTVHDPAEFPGPKSWPAVMALISFFALCAFLQGLLPSLGLTN